MNDNSFIIGNRQKIAVMGFVYRKKLSYSIFCTQGNKKPFRLKNFGIHKDRLLSEKELNEYARLNNLEGFKGVI